MNPEQCCRSQSSEKATMVSRPQESFGLFVAVSIAEETTADYGFRYLTEKIVALGP